MSRLIRLEKNALKCTWSPIDCLPRPHNDWCNYPTFHGRPAQNDPHRRNESHHPSSSILESWNIWALGRVEDRPIDPPAFPDVLCLELVLHMAYVAPISKYIALWTNFKLEFNDYNGALFDIQARSLNNLVYWLAQIVGSLFMGFVLDQKKFSRRTRAFSGWTLLFAMVWVVHIWAYFYQRFVCLPVLFRFGFKSPSSSGITLGNLCHLTHPNSTFTAMDMLLKSGFTFFAVFWMPCGKSRLTGSWAPCPMIPQNSLTSLGCVSGIVVLFGCAIEMRIR